MRLYARDVACEYGFDTEESVSTFAGDFLPTFVTPSDARNYIRETDAAWRRLESDAESASDSVVISSWKLDLAGWQQFRDVNLKDVGWLNTKAVMDQTDRWLIKAGQWRTTFANAGIKVVGPAPLDAGQGDQTRANPFTPYLIGGGIALTAVVVLSIGKKVML